MSKEIGERVLGVRSDSGLNQRDFAAQLGLSSGGISQIESGKTMPSGDFLLRIHEKFKVDVTWLLTGHRTPASVATAQAPPCAPALTADEAELLAWYRESHPAVQRSIKAALKEAAPRAAGDPAGDAPKRGRGRPRKSG